jgi:perosamine synthetase
MKTPDWIKIIKNPELKGEKVIPIYAPVFLGNEKKYLNECIDDSWISSKGNFVTRFEESFAEFCGCKYACSSSAGTSSIFFALKAMGIGKGNEVIVPAMTMISTAFAVSYTQARPVFVDSDPITGNINPESIEHAITSKTKAIIPVHLYGNPADMNRIKEIADSYHLVVMEDAAEAIGAKYQNRRIGSISQISAFSTYVNKIITTGQGGMITTNSKELYDEIKRLNNYYFSDVRHFWHEKIGYNRKMSNMQAAVGLAQIEKADQLITKKQQIAKWYQEYLKRLSNHIEPLGITKKSLPNYWMIAYKLHERKDQSQPLREYLAEQGIETRTFFIPLHLQPVYHQNYLEGQFPVAEQLCRTGILLPSGVGLTEPEVEFICDRIYKFFNHHL